MLYRRESSQRSITVRSSGFRTRLRRLEEDGESLREERVELEFVRIRRRGDIRSGRGRGGAFDVRDEAHVALGVA